MENALPEILAAALSLPDGDRANIAYELLASLKPPGVWSDDDPGFAAELQRRMDEYERDPSTAMSIDDVNRRLRQALADHRKS